MSQATKSSTYEVEVNQLNTAIIIAIVIIVSALHERVHMEMPEENKKLENVDGCSPRGLQGLQLQSCTEQTLGP